MELQGDFVLAGVALRHIVQRDLKGCVGAHVEAEQRPVELGRAPVPPLQGQLLL